MNKHEINTVQDMIDCTNESNLDNFLADLKLVIMSAHLIGKGESKGFTWIDDNKNNVETILIPKQP